MEQKSQTRRLFIGLAVGAVFGLGVGLLVGLAFAYSIAPLEWTDAGPQDLREDYAAYYWELVADSYAKHGNVELAKRQLGNWADAKKLEAALGRARIESSPELKIVLDSLEKKVVSSSGAQPATPAAGQTPTVQAKPKTGTGIARFLPYLGVLLLLVLALAVIVLLVLRSRRAKQSPTPAATVEETPEWLATMSSEAGVSALPPLGHFVTSYSLGNDNYDESFSIETAAGDFLGECGVGISETIGVGDPDKVTAFEVWLFDKNDIRTVTKVMMSEHAYNDPELRANLASKGEAALVQIGMPIVLETATLRVDATVTEAAYGSGALPPSSFFDRLTVELVAHQKEPSATVVSSPEDEPTV
jgi:hypothetical protein